MEHHTKVGIATKVTARSVWIWERQDPHRRAAAVRLLISCLPRYDRAFYSLTEALVEQVLEGCSRKHGLAQRVLKLLSRKRGSEQSTWDMERGAEALSVLADHCGAFAARPHDVGLVDDLSLKAYILAQLQLHEGDVAQWRSRRN